jgi:hypothetical protein
MIWHLFSGPLKDLFTVLKTNLDHGELSKINRKCDRDVTVTFSERS